jgi:hypothetical protein
VLDVSRLRVIVGACAAVVVAVVVLVLSAGGGGGGELVSGSALAEAATATQRVAGASVSVYATVKTGFLSPTIRLRMHGIQNTRQRAADLVGAYENFPKKVPGQRPDGSVPFESITILPDTYVKSPLFGATTVVPAGKWLHIDFAKTGRELGIGDPTQFGSGDPSQVLQALRALSSRVERLGSDDVRGVPTTHYRGTVELRRLPDRVPPARRAAARRSAERLIQLTGTESYPLDVWVDGHHLVRRVHLKMTMHVQGRSITQEMTVELFDFGRKQKIKRPPAGDTVEAPPASAAGP